jgi:hypothetical protein
MHAVNLVDEFAAWTTTKKWVVLSKKMGDGVDTRIQARETSERVYRIGGGGIQRKRKQKWACERKPKPPREHMHGMKNKISSHFGKKTKVGMGTKTKTPGEANACMK